MKYAIAFVAVFAVVAASAALLRVGFSGENDHGAATETPHDHNAHEQTNDHAGHNGDDHTKHNAPDHADTGDGVFGGEVKLDLRNSDCPVTGDYVGAGHDSHAHAVYHGFLIHFADEDAVARFKRQPIRYLQRLELEKTPKGEVIKVDASTFKDPPRMPQECPMMGGDITPEDEVYILHRGWRIYFCCWAGCADDFLEDPAAHYAVYGLEEKDGELVAS